MKVAATKIELIKLVVSKGNYLLKDKIIQKKFEENLRIFFSIFYIKILKPIS